MSIENLSRSVRREDWDAALQEIQQISQQAPVPSPPERVVCGPFFVGILSRVGISHRADNWSTKPTTNIGGSGGSSATTTCDRQTLYRFGTQIVCIVAQRVGADAEKERRREELLQLLLQTLPPSIFENRTNFSASPEPDLPLHAACGGWDRYEVPPVVPRKNDEIITMLLHSHPKAARVRNCKGGLPLHLAASAAAVGKMSPPVLELLVKSYPRACRLEDDNGDCPLHLLCMFYKLGDSHVAPLALESLRILLRACPSAARRRRTLSKRLPLHELALSAPTQSLASPTKEFVISAARLLLEKNRSAIHEPDAAGVRPFQYGFRSRCAPLVQFLLSVDPSQSSLGSTDARTLVPHVPLHEILMRRYNKYPLFRLNSCNLPIYEKHDLAIVDTVKCLVQARREAASEWIRMPILREHVRILSPLHIFSNPNVGDSIVTLLPIQLCALQIVSLLQLQTSLRSVEDSEAKNSWLQSQLRNIFEILSVLINASPLLIWAKDTPHQRSVVEMVAEHERKDSCKPTTEMSLGNSFTITSILRIAFPKGLHVPYIIPLPGTTGDSTKRRQKKLFVLPFVAACLSDTSSLDAMFTLLRHDPHVALAS